MSLKQTIIANKYILKCHNDYISTFLAEMEKKTQIKKRDRERNSNIL